MLPLFATRQRKCENVCDNVNNTALLLFSGRRHRDLTTPNDFREDAWALLQATQLVKAPSSAALNQALSDVMSLGRVLYDLGTESVWSNRRLAMEVLRILALVQESSFYQNDPQSVIQTSDQLRHRYVNVYGEAPEVNVSVLLDRMINANWVHLPRNDRIRLYPLGRRMVGWLLRLANESYKEYQMDPLERQLHQLRRAESYVQVYDEMGIDGADLVGQMVAGVLEMCRELRDNLSLHVFRRQALARVEVLRAELLRIQERFEMELDRSDRQRTPSQLHSLRKDANDAYSMTHLTSYETIGQVFQATSDLGNAPTRRIDEERWHEFLKQLAVGATDADGVDTALQFVDADAPFWLPFSLRISVDAEMLERGMRLMGEAVVLPTTPLSPVVIPEPQAATAEDLVQVFGTALPDDFKEASERLAGYLSERVDVPLAQAMEDLTATPADTVVHVLAASHMVMGPQAQLRIVNEPPPTSQRLIYTAYEVVGAGHPTEPCQLCELPGRTPRLRAGTPLRKGGGGG